MNTSPFDFEKEQPPVLREAVLKEENERRELKKQIKWLKISSLLVAFYILLFAFFVLKESLFVSLMAVAVLFFYLAGYGVLSVLFFTKGYHVKK